MANARFSGEIDKILGSVNSRILISSDEGSVQGFVTSDFSISGSNSFTNAFGAASQEAGDKIIRTATQIGNVIAGNEKIAQRKLQAIDSTIHSWTGSARPSLNIPLIFMTIRETDDVREYVKILMRMVYPTEEGLFVVAPLKYDGTGGGTVSLQIGKWLMIHGLVVLSVNAVLSQQVVKMSDDSTRPLFAKVDMVLEPYKQPTVDDIEGYFI
jgi:hypothetical protein